MTYPISRRSMLKSGALAAAASLVRSPLSFASRLSQRGPKYLIQIHYDLGLSTCAMFDARPHIFTSTGMFHNYLYEPVQANDQDPLAEFRLKDALAYPSSMGRGFYSPILASFMQNHGKDIAIVNGVHMSKNDGHGQNKQTYLTGSMQRSNLFMDLLRHPTQPRNSTYSAIFLSTSGFDAVDLSKYLITQGASLRPMLNMFSEKAPKVHYDPRFTAELKESFDALKTKTQGAFAAGVEELWKAGIASDELIDKLRESSKGVAASTDQLSLLPRVSALVDSFAVGLSSHGVLQVALDTDSHDAGNQRQKLRTIVTIRDQLNELLTWLKNTKAPDGLSNLFDQTVVTVAGEFDRTTREDDHATGHGNIFNSGSDHNQYSNTVLLFGGGIKGGQVIGETDMDVLPQGLHKAAGTQGYGAYSQAAAQHLQKSRSELYPAHLEENRVCNRVMGKPWDFSAEGGRGKIVATPTVRAYDRRNYITMQSIQNTILEHFGFREAFHLTNDPSSFDKAKILPRLLG